MYKWVVWAALTTWAFPGLVWATEGGGGPRLVSQGGGGAGEPLPRPGAATREREIAAIFREVAYGAPTTASPSPQPIPTTTTQPPPTSHPPTPNQTSPKPSTNHGGEDKRRKEGLPERTIAGPPDSDNDTPNHVDGEGSGVNSTTIIGAGPRWGAGVVVGGAWGIVGAAALVLAGRVGGATQLLPAPRYLALHLLLVSSAAARGLHLLPPLAPLPPPAPELMAAAGDSAWPLLTAGAAVVAAGAAVAWVAPPHPRLALALTLTAVAHLAVLTAAHISMLFGAPRQHISLAVTALAVVWGATVGVAGVWAAWAAGRTNCPSVGEIAQECGRPRVPAVLLLWAGLGQVSGAGARVWAVAAPPSLEWAWWGGLALPHALDLVVGVALLGAAARTLPTSGTRACWWQRRAAEVVPAVKLVQPMGVYTVTPTAAPPKVPHSRTLGGLGLTGGRGGRSLDYVTTDFQLVWSHPRPPTHESEDGLMGVGPSITAPEVFTCTLPSYKLYAAPPPLHLGDMEGRAAATLSRGSNWRGAASPQSSLRGSRSWDQLSTHHIYEEPHPRSPTPTFPPTFTPPTHSSSSSPISQRATPPTIENVPPSPTLTPMHLPHPARRPLAHHHSSGH